MKRIVLLACVLISTQGFAATTGADSSMKTPNISGNALFLYRNSNFHKEDANASSIDTTPNGANLQETELQFYSDVDPYTRLNLVLSLHPEYKANGTDIDEKWVIEPEEAFAESLAISNLTVRLGKFKGFMGKHNTLHTHAFPLIDAPLANTALMGDEGLNDIGLSVAGLIPLNWFSELSLQYLRGKGENAEFKSPKPSSGVGLIHWKNLMDVNEDLTAEVGVSYAGGENSYRSTTTLGGADLTFKWRPSTGGRYSSLAWATEYLQRTQKQDGVADEKASGIATWLQYQFAERWSALYRFDNLKAENSFTTATLPNSTQERHSAALVFAPSEFSSYRLEASQRKGGVANAQGDTTDKTILLQANFTIGSHPAHNY